MTRVRLHGKLASEMGRDTWDFEITQVREVVAALDANTDGRFRAFLLRHREVEFRVVVDGKDVVPVPHPSNPTEQGVPPDFYLQGQFSEIEIVPVPAGAAGFWTAIAGAVLAVVGVALLFTPLAPLSGYLIAGGLAMAAGGIAQMLAPTPQLAVANTSPAIRGPLVTGTERSGGAKLTSYLFNGVANTVGEGGPVPIVYGEMLIGAQIASIGLHTTSLQGATIGSDKPPSEDNYFFDLPMWDELAAQGKAIIIENAIAIKQKTNVQIAQYWLEPFWLPARYPASWPVAKLRSKPIPVKVKRALLLALSGMFNNALASVTLAQARDLYRLLRLNSLSTFDFEHSGWALAMEHVGRYYLQHEFEA